MRLLLYTGKGGVGKTSVAAATALRAAELGYKTIVLSTDAAHSLADSFDLALGNEPHPIAPNLWGQETQMSDTIEHYWGTIKDWLVALMSWRGMDEIVADEMAILPGMEELANLLYIANYSDRDDYQVIVVDCAPTGETLRLLSFPEVLRWWMEKLFPIERKAASLIRPLVRPWLDIPFPGNDVFDSVQHLYKELERTRSLLTKPELSSVRLVVNPEKMVIKEAQRTYTYLNLYGYSTDLVVCNRLIPEWVEDTYFKSWKESQGKYLRIIEEGFAPLPILTIPLFDQEVVGVPRLKLMAQALYGDKDPTQLFFVGRPQTIEKADGHYVISLNLPFASKENISLLRNNDELVIRVGDYRRNVVLPHILVNLPVEQAKFEGNQLKIHFAEPLPKPSRYRYKSKSKGR